MTVVEKIKNVMRQKTADITAPAKKAAAKRSQNGVIKEARTRVVIVTLGGSVKRGMNCTRFSLRGAH